LQAQNGLIPRTFYQDGNNPSLHKITLLLHTAGLGCKSKKKRKWLELFAP